MRKKIAVSVILLLVSGLIILTYFIYQGRKTLLTDPYKAISPDACIVIETVDIQNFFKTLASGKGIFGELAGIPDFKTFFSKITFISDRLNNPELNKTLHPGPAVISFHQVSGKKLQPFFSMTVPAETGFRQIRESLRLTGFSDFNETRQDGMHVFMVPCEINNTVDTLYLTVKSGMLLAAKSAVVFYKAVVQSESSNDIRNSPGFRRVLLTSGRNEDKVFIIFRNIAPVIRTLLKPSASYLADKISNLAGTAGGDIHINDKGITLSGYSEGLDSTEILHKFKSVSPGSFDTYRILPSSTALFESLILPVENTGKKQEARTPARINDLAARLRPYLGNEITRAYLDIRGKTAGESSVIIYRLKNRVQCERILDEVMRPEMTITYFEPDDQTRIPVYRTGSKGLASVIMPGFAHEFIDSHYAFFDSYMITGSDYSTVSRILYDNILNKTLANDVTFRDFEEMLPSRAGYYFYCVPSHIVNFLSGYLNENFIRTLSANRNTLGKIESAGYQFASINGMIYNNLSVRYREEIREESQTEWETLLDTVASIKPFFFTNHNTGAREIFIQDMNNNVYLINTAGRVLWKVSIDEGIQGQVYMIDYYRNGKYQLLFAGRNKLHLLDRNGNYVARYPVRLRSPATNALALFDYDNNKNYRLTIAGEDKLIYTYDREGNVVKGWKPFRTAGIVTTEASFFRVSGKDYIVVADETSIYFLDRSGNERLRVREPVTRAKSSGLRLVPGSPPSVICTAPDGTVQNIFFDGKVKKLAFRPFTFDHCFDFFDVDSDGFGEYVFIDQGILYLYDHNRKEMFTRKFDSDELGGPIYFNFSATDRKIGVFDVKNKLIYLIGKDGEVMNGFPKRGASMFSITRLTDKNDWHLIVGGTDRFLYNYKLETE